MLNNSVYEHVLARGVDPLVHRFWVDEKERIATFPLWNLSNQMVGYQVYRPDAGKVRKNDLNGRYYTYRGKKHYPKHSKTLSMWGLESWNFTNTLFITEGIFDACRLTKLGYSALAMIANDPNKSLSNWLYICRALRPVIAVCDSGKAGFKLAKHGHQYHVVEDGDLGDQTDEYVLNLASKYQ